MDTASIDLEAEVAALGNLSREGLAALWKKAFGCPPPPSVRHKLLVGAAAWHLQVKHLGGLSPAASRLLRQAIADAEAALPSKSSGFQEIASSQSNDRPRGQPSRSSTDARQTLRPGARLMRDWNGRTYVVDVLEEGYAFEGKLHRSLSAIARQITGTQWSGPRFFGL